MSNFQFVASQSGELVSAAESFGLMHGYIRHRIGARIRIRNQEAIGFSNCSYLGLDTDPEMIEAASRLLRDFGLHYCAARSRLSIGPLRMLELGLSRLFGSWAVTFPSVTSAHQSALPLVASGILLDGGSSRRQVNLVFDRFAHASMQSQIPALSQMARVAHIPHNDMAALARELAEANRRGQECVYLADGIYSMGGAAPLPALFELMDRGLHLYIDDAHGTSIVGDRGQGYVAAEVGKRGTSWPRRLFVNFSLAKGFGCNGGGIILPTRAQMKHLRHLGQTYLFSGPLDFAMTGAAIKCLEYHFSGRVAELQEQLRGKIALLDEALGLKPDPSGSPVRMVQVGDEKTCIAIGSRLLEQGYFVPTVFFPVVPRGESQLRICITVQHTEEQLLGLARAIRKLLPAASERDARV